MEEVNAELEALADMKRCEVKDLEVSHYIKLLKNAKQVALLEVACCDCMGDVSKVLRQFGIDT